MALVTIPNSPPLANTNGPGAVPHWPPTLADVGADSLASGTVPAFVANAASIAPGTDKASSFTIEAARTVAAPSNITIATTGLTSRPCNVLLLCKALNLGQIVTVVNGGSAGGNIGTFAATLTKSEVMNIWWTGTNFIHNGQDWVA